MRFGILGRARFRTRLSGTANWPQTMRLVLFMIAAGVCLISSSSVADFPEPSPAGIQETRESPPSAPTAMQTPIPPPGTLQLSLYVTAIDEIDLLSNSFNAQFYLSTVWPEAGGENPSDRLEVLNAIHNNDIGRFELISHQSLDDLEWRLYAVRSKIINPWILSNYPFDSQLLRIRIGMSNPMEESVSLGVDRLNSYVHPELILYDWQMGALDLVSGFVSIVGNLGLPGQDTGEIYQTPVVNALIEMRRRGHLEFVPSFLGYFLAIGLCVLALAISRSRDDLILGAVVSAAANSVYLAEILPVSALGGFSGQIQIIVYTGILYAATADELTDHVPPEWNPRIGPLLKLSLLPVYLLSTVLAIYVIVPSQVM